MKKVIALSLVLAAGTLMAHDEPANVSPTAKSAVAAPQRAKKAKKAKKKAAVKKEHWVCPMHDGGESDHAGKCPKCGMDLELEK